VRLHGFELNRIEIAGIVEFADFRIEHLDMPATAQRIWSAIRSARV